MLTTKDLEKYLKENNITYEIQIHEETYSAAKASEILKVEIDKIIKSLIFINEKDEPILVIIPGNKKVNQTKLAKMLGFKKLRLAKPEEVIEHTGYEAGGVPPVGHKKQLQCYIDEEIIGKEFVYGGGGAVNATLKIKPKDIIKLTQGKVIRIPI
jgi:Cys-tRNA(Pro) deacylase